MVHTIALVSFGFSYFRMPFFEQLKIFGGQGEGILKWVTYDVSWPPVRLSKWRP